MKERKKKAENYWNLGLQAESENDLPKAYEHYTQAHNLIMDCAKLHERSHQHLKRINAKMGNRGEWVTDCLLHLFAPLGVFELVSYFAKTDAFGSEICKRS